MKIAIINGPNLNMLGVREPEIYGYKTYDNLVRHCEEYAFNIGLDMQIFQSNYEGAILEFIHSHMHEWNGLIINPAAFSYYSVALLDCLKMVKCGIVEVHLTDLNNRTEAFRKHSIISPVADKVIMGKGFEGYIEAIDFLLQLVE